MLAWTVCETWGQGAETLATRFVHSSIHPSAGRGQDATTLFVTVRVIVSHGAPGVCTAAMRLQNPPVSE